jgi:hypothetical protein
VAVERVWKLKYAPGLARCCDLSAEIPHDSHGFFD